jgi:hypothetical protein
MKQFTLFLSIIAILGFGYNANGQDIKLNNLYESEFVISHNDYSNLNFSNTLSDVSFFNIKTSKGTFQQINAEGYGHTNLVGQPKLPVLKRLIEVPLNSNISIKILNQNFEEYSLSDFGIQNKIIPAQASISKSIDDPQDLDFVIDESVYATDDFLSSELVSVKHLGTMRSVEIARLEIAPVQYNPVTNTIRVYHEINAEVIFNGSPAQTLEKKRDLFSPHFEGVYDFLANYKNAGPVDLIDDEPVTYIIVSDPMFETALQTFIDWKVKKGFYVVEAYTDNPSVGTTTTSIHNYLQTFYNNPPAGYNPQSFVLFVGDIAQIPVYSGTSGSHYSDLYYCDYTGDIYPECFYGRFSAENITELQPQIDKTLEYEQYLMPDPSFLDEVVMVAGADASYGELYGNGQINYGTTYYFNAAHGLLSHTYLQPEPSGGNYSTNIRQNVSDGVSFANYTAHCSSSGWADPSFNTGHVSAMTNASQYPLMVGNCCLSNKFDVDDCFGEELLQAQNKGAIGYIGGSNSTYWDEDFWWGVGYEATVTQNPVYHAANLGAYDRTFHDNGEVTDEWFTTQGQMVSAGNLAVTQSGSSRETYYWEIYHLMGDPSLMVYFTQAPATNATYAGLMPLGSTTFNVSTEPYAYIGISKDGVLHGAAIADATGAAIVNLNPINVPGIADIVVTRQNGQPFIGTITVASPSGPYLNLSSFDIDDSAGNDNGEADYNESVALDVTLENLGSDMGTNLTASLSSSDANIVITDGSHAWPDIPAGNTSTQLGAFAFDVNDNIVDQHIVAFDLQITDESEIWSSTLNVTLNAPFLETGYLTIDDASGNANGRLDPGETVDLIIPVINNGHSQSPLASGTLTSASSWITINSGSSAIGQINQGSSQNASFSISCSASAPVGTSVDFDFSCFAGNYSCANVFYESIGLVVEDWETGDMTKFPWTTSGNTVWSVNGNDVYEGSYSAQSGTITHSQVSELSVILQVSAADDISFYRKVSSESNYDYLQFWIDGTMIEEWSGEVAWSQVTFPVTAGAHTFKWVYDKDGSVDNGSDCAWIDFIIFPPVETPSPSISVNPTLLEFGDVIIGETATQEFTITNIGSLTLSGSIETPLAFTISEAGKAAWKEAMKNSISFSIAPNTSQNFNITFEPLNTQCYSANTYIYSNDPDQATFNLGVTGCGILGPNLVFDPASFNVSLPVDGMTTKLLNLTNNGDVQLDYNAHIVFSDPSKAVENVYPTNSNYNTGTTNGTTKTQVSMVRGWDDEDGWFKFDVSSIPVGATINSVELYAYVNETYYPYWSATSLPIDPVASTASEIRTWVEAHSENGTAYYYGNESSSFPTGWHNWMLSTQANTDLETALLNGWFAVGMDSRDNSTSYYIVFDGWNESNPPYLVVDYTYNPPYTWLTLDGGNVTSGSLLVNEHASINVGFDATELAEGTYNADIYLNSNDPDEPMVIIPVALIVTDELQLNVTVMMEGPFNGIMMTTDMVNLPDFPVNQPFGAAPWNYYGTEAISGTPSSAVVDWVLVELRDASSAALADPSTIVARQAALLLNDGSVVSADTYGGLSFITVPVNGLYVVVHNHNHLSVMSANPIGETGGIYGYDFSTALNQAYGDGDAHKQIASGVWGMIAGDANCDGGVTALDLSAGWDMDAGKSGYQQCDFNFDGQVDNKDKDDYWLPNDGRSCQVPE